MKLTDVKDALDQGQVFKLDLPARPRYVAASYRVWRSSVDYSCTVQYPGTDIKLIAGESQWDDFLRVLPLIIKQSSGWEVTPD
jgi:hypothetical protein